MATEPSYEVTIVGLQRDKRAVLDFLQTSGVLHVTDVTVVDQDEPLESVSRIAQELLTVKWMREQLGIVKDERAYSNATIEESERAFETLRDDLYDELRELEEKRIERTSKLETLRSRRDLLARIPFELPHGIRLPHKGPRTFALMLEHDHDMAKVFANVKATIEEANGYALITGSRGEYDMVHEAILEHNLRVLELEPLSSDRVAELAELEQAITSLETQEEAHAKRIAQLRTTHEEAVLTIDRDLTVLHERYEKPLSFGRTASTFVAQGFVPRSKLEVLEAVGSVAQVDVSIDHASSAPVKLSNPPYVRRFEFVTGMFGMPKYGTIDPTPFVAFFLPLFFGFMFSDVGYGLLLGVLASWISTRAKARTPILSDAAFVLAVCAASTIAFGFAFGSFFGELVPMPALVIDPFENAQVILIAALTLGLVHLNLGLVLSVVEHVKHRRFSRIAFDALPFFALQAAGLLFALSAPIIGWAALAVTVGLLFARSRIMGVMEITSFIGTWFSYARLLALALATAGIALGVNIIAQGLISTPFIGPVLFVIFVIFGHLFNFALNVLGSSIHSVRLHYIEFFSQFYESGGDPYRPFETDEKQHTL